LPQITGAAKELRCAGLVGRDAEAGLKAATQFDTGLRVFEIAAALEQAFGSMGIGLHSLTGEVERGQGPTAFCERPLTGSLVICRSATQRPVVCLEGVERAA
jgi:hypothetical protein